jgi:hypothetical protein
MQQTERDLFRLSSDVWPSGRISTFEATEPSSIPDWG